MYLTSQKYTGIKRHIDQWDRTDCLEINLYLYGELTLGKGARNTRQVRDSLFSKRCWENWIFICKRMKWNSYLTFTKINSKYVEVFIARLETIKLLE